MKRKEENKYFLLLYYILAIFIILAVIITLSTASYSTHRHYDMQIEASNKTLSAMTVLKEREEEVSKNYDYGNGFYESFDDKKYYDEQNLNTGMIGAEYTAITTTIGNLDSKKTSLNPNFAAVYIKIFEQLSLKKGDEIVINSSGSFPMLGISCVIAAEEYGLKPFVMTSIGASSYGATNPAFTIFDMLEYLYEKEIIKTRINIVSLGGNNDIGDTFGKYNDFKDQNAIIERINKSGVTFLYEKHFDTNIEKRLQIINENTKNVKLFANIGGNSVGIGVRENAYYKENGILYANKYKKTSFITSGEGLIEKFLSNGVDVIQMLNLKQIAAEYGLEYGFNKLPDVGTGDAYYEKTYNLTYSIIAILAVLAFLIYYKKRRSTKEN